MAKKRPTSSIGLHRTANKEEKAETKLNKVETFNEKMQGRLQGLMKKVIG